MNYASPEKLAQLADSNRCLQRVLLHKVTVLKERLDNFTVVDTAGKPVGEVRNLVLYKRRLHLVIVQPDVHRNWRFMLLRSHLVQQISTRDRVILTRTTHTDMNYLPEQRSTAERASLSHSATAHASVMAPVSQLPASLMRDRTQHLEATEKTRALSEMLVPQAQGTVKVSVTEYPTAPKVVADTVADTVDASVGRFPDRNKETNGTRRAPAYPGVTSAQPVAVRVSERLS